MERIPKTLLTIKGHSLMERMVKDLQDVSAEGVYIVTGFREEKIKKHAAELAVKYELHIELVGNKDYATTNTGFSLLLALDKIDGGDVIILNGDVIYDRAIFEGVVNRRGTCLAIDDVKELTEESFKIITRSGRIAAIGKELPLDKAIGEYMGIAKIRESDCGRVRSILRLLVSIDQMVYYDVAFKELSHQRPIDFLFTAGRKWTEIDFVEDFEYAEEIAGEIDRSRW